MTSHQRNGGRPTKYHPSYCDRVVEYGRAGKSRAWIAAELGVVKQTLLNWASENPEFLDALEYANTLSQQWWEDAGQSGMTADKFNNGVWSRSMAARFPEDWREKVAHVGDRTEDPIQQSITLDADAFTRRIIGAASRASEGSEVGRPEPADQG